MSNINYLIIYYKLHDAIFNHTKEAVNSMLDNSIHSALVTNLVTTSIFVYVSYKDVSMLLLVSFVTIHLLLFSLKLYAIPQIKLTMNNDFDSTKNNYFKLLVYLVLTTALLHGVAPYLFVYHGATESAGAIIGTISILLVSGALTTLGQLYLIYVLYISLITIPFIISLFLFDNELYLVIASVLFLYYIFNLVSGYRLYRHYKSAVSTNIKFKAIYDQSADGIAIMKGDKSIQHNKALVSMFGYDISSKDFFEIELKTHSPKHQPDGMSSIRKMIKMLNAAKKEIVVFDWQHCKSNGQLFWVEITLRAIMIENISYTHGVWRDISDKKNVERELETLNKHLKEKIEEEVSRNRAKDKIFMEQSRLAQMGEMLSMIAHQWRQPLNSISLTTSNLILQSKLGTLEKKTIDNELVLVEQYAQHLSSTIDDFRNFFKKDKIKNITTLDTIVENSIKMVSNSIALENIEIKTNLDSKDELEIFSSELMQVILNMLTNSKDALVESKIKDATITITTHKNQLILTDNGFGISKDIQEKIFDPYFSTKKDKNGTGLGLYMSKIIIEEHCGGTIKMEDALHGAKFVITL